MILKKQTIIELCSSPDLGGLELFVVDAVESLKEECNVIAIINEGSKLEKYFKDQRHIKLKKQSKAFLFFKAKKLAKLIDENNVEVIHIHWTKDILLAVLAKLFSSSKPKIVQSRHMTMTRFKSDLYHKWLYKNIDTIHAVTHQVEEQLIKYIPEDVRPKVQAVYLGVNKPVINLKKVDELKALYKIKDEFIVGMVGRIQENKGQYLLVDALAKLQDLNIKVLIVGHSMDEKYEQLLKQKVKSCNLENKIIFTGFTQDVNEHISLFDVSVLATKKETFGLVVIESMINKVPVIATAEGGPLEIIEDGVDGLFFDRSVDDLIKKIIQMYENNSFKQELSYNAYEKVKNKYNKEIQMKKLSEVICES